MKTQFIQVAFAGLLALSIGSCNTPDAQPSPYESGVYVINQGNFSQGNGSISYLATNANTVATDIFQSANGVSLGGLVQDYTEIDGKGVATVNNQTAGQSKIQIVEIGTFKSLATLGAPAVENPRYVVRAGLNRAYVTCWGKTGGNPFFVNPGYVLALDLASRTITKTIPVMKGAERMVVVGSEAFVGSASYSGDNTLTIIDVTTDAVKQSLTFSAPAEPIAVDAEGKLWLRSGNDMVRMDPTSRAVEKRLTFPAAPDPIALGADNRTFYTSLNGRTYRFSIGDTSVPTNTPFIQRGFAALGVEPQSGTIYASQNPVFYDRANYVLRYQSGGTLIDSVKAEIAPSGFFFR